LPGRRSGCDSHPHDQSWEVFRRPDCKSGFAKAAGSDGWSVTSTSHQCPLRWLKSRAPLCLRQDCGCRSHRERHSRGGPQLARWLNSVSPKQVPGPLQTAGATSAWCSSNIPGLGPGDRRCESCRADDFPRLPWPKQTGLRLLNEPMQVRVLPAASLPGGVKVARRPVKPLVLVRVQAWQPIPGRQADRSWLHLSRKQDRRPSRSVHYRRFPPRPVAQKQSARLITGRSRSVTCPDDHFPQVGEAD
jgi:hypothetical protein